MWSIFSLCLLCQSEWQPRPCPQNQTVVLGGQALPDGHKGSELLLNLSFSLFKGPPTIWAVQYLFCTTGQWLEQILYLCPILATLQCSLNNKHGEKFYFLSFCVNVSSSHLSTYPSDCLSICLLLSIGPSFHLLPIHPYSIILSGCQ